MKLSKNISLFFTLAFFAMLSLSSCEKEEFTPLSATVAEDGDNESQRQKRGKLVVPVSTEIPEAIGNNGNGTVEEGSNGGIDIGVGGGGDSEGDVKEGGDNEDNGDEGDDVKEGGDNEDNGDEGDDELDGGEGKGGSEPADGHSTPTNGSITPSISNSTQFFKASKSSKGLKKQ